MFDWFFVGFWAAIGAVAGVFVLLTFTFVFLALVAWVDARFSEWRLERYLKKRKEWREKEADAGGRAAATVWGLEGRGSATGGNISPPREPGPIERAYISEAERRRHEYVERNRDG